MNQFGDWKPIGAEQVAGGYKVVWQFGTADQFTVWTTDSNGNLVSQSAAVLGSDPLVASLEPSFNQDLNGVGGITPPTTTIEAAGATQLVQTGGAYLLQPVGGSSGPQLNYGGAVVTVNQFADWKPVGAEQTARMDASVARQFGSDQKAWCGTPTPTATGCRRAPACPDSALRWNRWKRASPRISMPTARLAW